MLWQLKLASGYTHLYTHSPPAGWNGGAPLLSQQYVATLNARVWRHLHHQKQLLLSVLKSYLLPAEGVWSRGLDALVLLVMELVWSEIPAATQLNLTSNCEFSSLNIVPLLQCEREVLWVGGFVYRTVIHSCSPSQIQCNYFLLHAIL